MYCKFLSNDIREHVCCYLLLLLDFTLLTDIMVMLDWASDYWLWRK